MYKTPSSKRGGWSKTKAPFTPRKKGLFEDGQWLCNCHKPALFLLVKKKGKNKGKHFYTCDEKKCDFFLWELDAKTREREALMIHNCLSENGIVGRVQAKGEPPATPVFAPRITSNAAPQTAPHQRDLKAGSVMSQDSDYLDYDTDETNATHQARAGSFTGSSHTMQNGSGSKSSGSGPHGRMPDFTYQAAATATPSAKRKRPVFPPDSDEEFGGDDLDDSDIERELVAAADESVRKKLFQTPAAERTVDRIVGGLPTPSTRTNRNGLLIADEDRERRNKRLRFSGSGTMPEDNETQSQSQSLPAGQGQALYIGDIGTPTPYRKTDALAPSTSGTPASARTASPAKTPTASDYPKITDEVMELLTAQIISETTRRNVRQLLERHEMRVKGVVMGRDAARSAVEAREGRVAELQARVVALENARRFDRERLKALTDGLTSLTQEGEE